MAERESVIDYTVHYYDLVGTSIMMKKVKTETSLFKFLSVLDGNVWACILAAYLVTRYVITKYYSTRYIFSINKQNVRVGGGRGRNTLVEPNTKLYTFMKQNIFVSSFSLIMWTFDRISPYSYQNNMEKFKNDEEQRYFSFKECLW